MDESKKGWYSVSVKVTSMQINLFDLIVEPPKPGDYVTRFGSQMTFDEIADSIGKLIVIDRSTEHHPWYIVVRVEDIIQCEGQRRLVYFTGQKQRGLINEMYFDESREYPARAFRLD